MFQHLESLLRHPSLFSEALAFQYDDAEPGQMEALWGVPFT